MSGKYFLSFFLLFFFSLNQTQSQAVVWTEPAFPTQLDDVTIYFDASEGNAALQGFNGTVYAHTGVISSASSNGSDWQHVQGNWGTIDANTEMTSIGGEVYTIEYNIEDYYNINPGEQVFQMAFVFRNADGSIVGRDTNGSDIFVDVFPPSDDLFFTINNPSQSNNNVIELTDSLLLDFELNKKAKVDIYDNGVLIFSDSTIQQQFYIYPQSQGHHDINIDVNLFPEFLGIKLDYYVLEDPPPAMDPPGTDLGLNYVSDENLIFHLYAPFKNNAFFLCPQNDFKIDEAYRMTQSLDGSVFWIELPKSTFDNGNNLYQYLVDGGILIADPFSEVVLDLNNDDWVPTDVTDELPVYPLDKTYGRITAFDLEPSSFDWTPDFVGPAKEDLVVYELLIRDFLEDRNYKSLTDTLDYLQRLGINAIELMPINEFEGNNSWGYNPSFHMAVDKYYGSRDQLKTFIDEAHKRGIAVILDVVFNHVFSQSPLAQLYWDNGNFRPTEESPYLNVVAKHPYNVGYDVNHESAASKAWVKRVLKHWIQEYHFDGFRFDLSKGMTQTNSGSNGDLMSQYDASRINILKGYADYIWSLDDDSYVILEHFAYNNEEKELSEYGMMLWGNINHEFNEAAMGYPSNINWADYQERDWTDPHLISYMESHDEERMMYKVNTWGNENGEYDTKEFITGFDRAKAASMMFFCIPGPKMIWQFAELGYDYSINHCENGTISPDCRLSPKPVRWDYQNQYWRDLLFQHYRGMIHLKTSYPTFQTEDYILDDADPYVKRIHLNHTEMNAVAFANFNVVQEEIQGDFQSIGTWYNYFTGDSLIVESTDMLLDFKPGEYRLYTDQRITPPDGFVSEVNDLAFAKNIDLFPNPIKPGELINLELEDVDPVDISLELLKFDGSRVDFNKRELRVPDHLPPGMYILLLKNNKTGSIHYSKLIVQE